MTPRLAALLALLTLAACGEPDEIDPPDAPAEEASIAQKDLRCDNGCCGSDYNCRVPDRDRRAGCSGARIQNPVIGGCDWPLTADADRSIHDGLGARMGEVRSAAVKLNQGIRKQRDGRWYVYAFNTTVRLNDGTLRPFSGWIRQSDLVHADRLHGYTLALDDPGRGHYETRWRITGGEPARFDHLVLRATDGETYPATDYLLRPYGLVHLTFTVPGFALGGHAVDSFQPGAIFRRARGVEQIRIALYGPQGHRSALSLDFAYGYVHDGEQRRYGWIAKQALEAIAEAPAPQPEPEPAPQPEPQPEPEPEPEPEPQPQPQPEPQPEPAHTCSARCCDGAVISGLAAASAAECVSASSPVCEDHGYVLRARFDGAVAYERERFCWAKCNNREAYHRVDGVTEDCAGAARTFCAGNDRGGLEDAAWDPCQPG